MISAFASAAPAMAHPEIEVALARLNPLIAAAPEDPALYLERGELYERHADGVQAEANYLRAAELAPQLPGLDRRRGALALQTTGPRDACQHLDRALALDPGDVEALVLRHRARAALRDRAGALDDLEHALRLIPEPRPELFLARAALLPAPADAIRSLDEAIARIGPVHTLELRALELAESAGWFDAALARLTSIADHAERKELWLKRRGDLLSRAGRAPEARAAYAAALLALRALPDWLRDSPDMATLAVELGRLTAPAS